MHLSNLTLAMLTRLDKLLTNIIQALWFIYFPSNIPM